MLHGAAVAVAAVGLARPTDTAAHTYAGSSTMRGTGCTRPPSRPPAAATGPKWHKREQPRPLPSPPHYLAYPPSVAIEMSHAHTALRHCLYVHVRHTVGHFAAPTARCQPTTAAGQGLIPRQVHFPRKAFRRGRDNSQESATKAKPRGPPRRVLLHAALNALQTTGQAPAMLPCIRSYVACSAQLIAYALILAARTESAG